MNSKLVLPRLGLKQEDYEKLKEAFVLHYHKQVNHYLSNPKEDIYNQLLKAWHKCCLVYSKSNKLEKQNCTITDLPISKTELNLINLHLIELFGIADMIDRNIMEINDILNRNPEAEGFKISAFDKLQTALREAKNLLNNHLNNVTYSSPAWAEIWDDCHDLIHNKVKSLARKLDNECKMKLTDKTPTNNK